MKRLSKCLLTLVSVFSLAGCNVQEPSVYLGDDSVCPIPCWYGITPGRSTIEESVSTLNSLPFITGTKTTTSKNVTDVFWRYRWITADGSIIFKDGKLIVIRITPSDLSLGDVFNKLGSPESVSAWYEPGDLVTYVVSLYYLDKGVVVIIADRPQGDLSDPQRITKDLSVSQIHLFEPTDLGTFLKEISGKSEEYVVRVTEQLQPWPGFGDDVIHVNFP